MQKNTKVIIVLASLVSGFVGFLAALIFFFFSIPTIPDKPLVIENTNPSPTAMPNYDCITESDSDKIQTCCQNWAETNNVAVLECIGEWKILDNECSWVCAND